MIYCLADKLLMFVLSVIIGVIIGIVYVLTFVMCFIVTWRDFGFKKAARCAVTDVKSIPKMVEDFFDE